MPINLLTRDDFTPKPAAEAARIFGKKTPLTSEQFETLSKENKARAFRIARVHKARLIQRARDIVKKGIEDGTDYAIVRRKLLELFDTEGVPRPALARLRTMFRQNSLGAYSIARTRVLKEPEKWDRCRRSGPAGAGAQRLLREWAKWHPLEGSGPANAGGERVRRQ